MNDTSLDVVVLQVQSGDRQAFKVLFDMVHDKLFVFASTRVREREKAIELVQDTLVDVWKQRKTLVFQGEAKFYAYLYLILRRKIIRVYGERKVDSLDKHLEEVGDSDPLIAEMPEYEDHRLLTQVIDALPDAAREIITLRYWSGLPYGDIAQLLGITENNAKVRHHRAIAILKEQLHHYGYTKI